MSLATAAVPDREWDAFVAAHADGSPFHLSAFLNAVEKEYGFRPAHRQIRDGEGHLAGVLPAFEARILGRKRVISLPYADRGGPLARSGDAEDALLRALPLAPFVEVRWPRPRADAPPGYGRIVKGHSYVLHTKGLDHERDLWTKIFDKDVRTEVRKAQRSGVSTEPSTTGSYHELHLDTMRRLGSPPHAAGFFARLADGLGDALRVRIARKDGEPVAGLLTLHLPGLVHVWGNVSTREGARAAANYLLYDEAIRDACARGDRVDFGRTEPGSTHARFKEKWGGERVDLASFVSPPSAARQADLARLRRLSRVTRYLSPVIASRILGPRLKRWVP